MLITSYGQKRERVIASIEKYLKKLETAKEIVEFSLEESGGAGSYETFYISFGLLADDPEFEKRYNFKNTKTFTVRFSGHPGSYSNPDFSLLNQDYKTVTELKKAILACIKQAREGEKTC